MDISCEEQRLVRDIDVGGGERKPISFERRSNTWLPARSTAQDSLGLRVSVQA